MNKPVCLNFPDEMLARIDAAAAAEQRSRSNMVRQIVQRQLDAHAELCRAGSPAYNPPIVPPEASVSEAVETHLQHHADLCSAIQKETT